MSKRHQASRRRTYGRRQHEVHERAERRDYLADREGGDEGNALDRDAFSLFEFDLSPRRLSFAAGD